jgi:hypothetical protein
MIKRGLKFFVKYSGTSGRFFRGIILIFNIKLFLNLFFQYISKFIFPVTSIGISKIGWGQAVRDHLSSTKGNWVILATWQTKIVHQGYLNFNQSVTVTNKVGISLKPCGV